MKRTLVLLLVLVLLCPMPTSGAERPKYLVLAFEGCPPQTLLEEMADRQIRATCFLRAEDCPQGGLLRDLGHEIGILSQVSPILTRREMARQLTDIRDRLPENCPVSLLLHRGNITPGLRQVADALKLKLLDPENGDLLLLDSRTAPGRVLWQIDRLREQGVTLVTLSALSRIQKTAH